MPAPGSIDAFLDIVAKSGVLDKQRLDSYVQQQRDTGSLPETPGRLAGLMVQAGLLTPFQVEQFLQGKWRGFILTGKYKLLEHLGSGGMGAVYLCEHTSMHRRVAIKVLPPDKAGDPAALDRFYREARAVAALDHPNIVRAHDIDHEGKQHFIVMEYVDGSSLHHIVKKSGPLEPPRAVYYIFQAAHGLHHAHEQGLVHRDIKPGNLLVDRNGTVKILDMGLARFFHDSSDNITEANNEGVLGTVDYLAPEQAVDSHVDIRADIYSLGMTFYFLLAGTNPFSDGTSAQKIIWHQVRKPKSIRSLRPEVPEALEAILDKMIAKDPAERFQTPGEVAEALAPWLTEAIPPPSEAEMPRLCPAVQAAGQSETKAGLTGGPARKMSSLSLAKSPWVITVAPPSPSPSPGQPTVRPRAAAGVADPSRAQATRMPAAAAPESGVAPELADSGAGANSGTEPQSEHYDLDEEDGDDDAVVMMEVRAKPPSAKKTRAMPVNEERETPSAERRAPMGSALRAERAARAGKNRWLVWTITTLVLMIAVGGAGAGIWLALQSSGEKAGDSPSSAAAKKDLKKALSAAKEPKARPAPRVAIEASKDGHRITTPRYEAMIAPDGCMTSLRVGGLEFLWTKDKISRGCYFFQPNGGGIVNLPNVAKVAENAVNAHNGPLAAVSYSFGEESLAWDVTNQTDKPMHFFIVFDLAVTAVINDAGAVAKTPVDRPWPVATWYAGKFKLTVRNGSKIWPGVENHQVWEATLKPRETRRIVLKVGATTPDEVAKVAAVASPKPAAQADITVESPLQYQVFQRYSRQRGQITLKGRVQPVCDKAEVRITGISLEGKLPDKWQPVALAMPNRTFDTIIPSPAGGWYQVEIRALNNNQVVGQKLIDKVGIGEVFVGAGQSNSTNCSEEQLKTTTGMVASFSGTHWQLANDPQLGVNDRSGGGSYWPAFGDALHTQYKVPIGVASTGYSGSSVNQWQPGSEHYKWMMTRIRQLGTGGFRAVLWHQGETDVSLKSEEYAQRLTTVIQASTKEGGWQFPWFVAQVSYLNPAQPSFPGTRDAQKKLWDTKIALEGPDTDTLKGDNRDQGGKGIHFSGKGQRAHGKMWADKVSVYLDKVLAK